MSAWNWTELILIALLIGIVGLIVVWWLLAAFDVQQDQLGRLRRGGLL